MLTWKCKRSPLRVHSNIQANKATFLLWTIQNPHARAIGKFCMVHSRETNARDQANFEIHSVTAEGSLEFPSKHRDLPIVSKAKLPQRAPRHARRGGELCILSNRKHTLEPALTWTSNRPPLRVHLCFLADLATFLW